MDPANVRKGCAHIGKAVGVTFSPQDLRRTFASLLLESGVPLDTISRYLGHSSVAVTETWYAGLEVDGDDTHVAHLSFGRAPNEVAAAGEVAAAKSEGGGDGEVVEAPSRTVGA